MPRIARAVAEGNPHHIVQRGNNREDVFTDPKDREQYLMLLKKYSDKWQVPVLAYCLMSNHTHLLVRPATEQALYKMMQGLTLCYTQYYNRKYGRTGRLWENRFHSFIVDQERYFWAVARYIEQNPVRASIVREAERYPYSSARAHETGTEDSVLGEEIFTSGQRNDYVQMLRSDLTEEEIEGLRYHSRSGRPLGGEEFVQGIEKRLRRPLARRPRGRPKKNRE